MKFNSGERGTNSSANSFKINGSNSNQKSGMISNNYITPFRENSIEKNKQFSGISIKEINPNYTPNNSMSTQNYPNI